MEAKLLYHARMAAVFVFTGENHHALKEEKARWVQEFTKKHGEDNMIRLDGKSQSLRTLLDEVSMMPFLAEKRLFVIDGIPKLDKEEVEVLLEQIHPQVIVLFTDPKPDKRLGGVKQLLAKAEVKEFAPLKGSMLAQWVSDAARLNNATLDPKARDLLIEFVGEDQEMLLREVEKLALHAGGKPVTKEDVDNMTIPTDEGVVWKMTDLLSAGRKKDAAAFVKKTLDRGGDAYGLWAILLSFLKNTAAVRIALDSGVVSSKEIAEETGVHPFALRSLLPYVQKCKASDINAFVRWAAESDIRLKTGLLRATDEAPEEIRALLDRFVLTCP